MLLGDQWTRRSNSRVRFVSPSPIDLRLPALKSELKSIIHKTDSKTKINMGLMEEMRKIEKEKKKYEDGIKKYFDQGDESVRRSKSVMQIMDEAAQSRIDDKQNFKTPEVVEQVREENFANSVYITYLGKQRIWKPDKFMTTEREQKRSGLL